MGGGAWWATVHGGGKESDTTEVTERTHMSDLPRWCPQLYACQPGILFKVALPFTLKVISI